MVDEAVAAYSATGGAWQRGPGRIYDHLAEVVVEHAMRPLAGARVLDAGAGTGAVSRAALAAGASAVIAADAAFGMLAHDADGRPPGVVGDLLSQPFVPGAFDVSIAAFSLNHLDDPVSGVRELARVTRTEGVVLGAVYAADDTHPVRDAVETAVQAHGWAPPSWLLTLKSHIAPLMSTADRCAAVLDDAGLRGAVTALRVPFPDLAPGDLVAWRLGMAQHAAFLESLDEDSRRQVVADALAALGGDPPPLERSILVFRAVIA